MRYLSTLYVYLTKYKFSRIGTGSISSFEDDFKSSLHFFQRCLVGISKVTVGREWHNQPLAPYLHLYCSDKALGYGRLIPTPTK